MQNKWPLQKDCVAFYGDPKTMFFAREHIVQIKFPWKCFFGKIPVSHASVHEKCSEAFEEWFKAVWINAGRRQDIIDAWGMSSYSGGFVVRDKRGASSLSMHSYGCALDFDAVRNGFRKFKPNFGTPAIHAHVVKPFINLGGVWGGDWNPPDGMHFQLARVR